MTEDRAHRPAMSGTRAAAELARMADDRTLDAAAVEAVLYVSGHRRRARKRRTHPAGLTDREVEVLRLAAQGLTIKQIAERLVLSPKTVDHHIQHVYSKIGVSTRGAAALYAMENDLVQPTTDA
jgi:DNA-binding NarL/FixJ family response regulator